MVDHFHEKVIGLKKIAGQARAMVPIYTYRNFPRSDGLTVEQSLGRTDPPDADRLRTFVLFVVPAGERSIGDRSGYAVQRPGTKWQPIAVSRSAECHCR